MFELENPQTLVELQSRLEMTRKEIGFLQAELIGLPMTTEFVETLSRAALGTENFLGGYKRTDISTMRDASPLKLDLPDTTKIDKKGRHLPSYQMYGQIDQVIAKRLEDTADVFCSAYKTQNQLEQISVYDLAGLTQRAIKIISLFNFSGTLDSGSSRGKLAQDKTAMWAIEAGSRLALDDIAYTIVAAKNSGSEIYDAPFLDSLEMSFRRIMNANLQLVAPHQQFMASAQDGYYLQVNFMRSPETGKVEIMPGSPLDLALFFSKNPVQTLIEEFNQWLATQKRPSEPAEQNRRRNGIGQIPADYWASLLAQVGQRGQNYSDVDRLAAAKQKFIEIMQQNADPRQYDMEVFYDGGLSSYYLKIKPINSLFGPRKESSSMNLIQTGIDDITSGCPFRKTMIVYFKMLTQQLPNLSFPAH